MKKIIINEDWEEVEVPDLSNFFVLIFKQGSDKAGYIKCYDTDEAPVFTEYDNLVNQYSNVKFEEPTSINVIKVPATGQVKAMLEETPYEGDETNKDKIETINHLLGRADCECLKEKVLMSLEEAKKKKKKKKKTPRVTYTMGFPYLNDHRFNHACGTCDCGKNPGEDAADNINDAIGGGEATGGEGIGDAGPSGDVGGDGGAMGEALVNEAMNPIEKMRALENGTRGFNAPAASDAKLVNNLNICTKNNLPKAAAIMRAEIQRRMNAGIWTLGQVAGLNVNAAPTTATPAAQQPASAPQQAAPVNTKIDLDTFDFWYAGQHYLEELDARILKHYVEDNDIASLVKSLENQNGTTPQISLSYSLANLLFAICFNYPEAIQALRDSIMKVFGFSAAEIKQYLKDKLLSNSAVMSKIRKAIDVILTEQVHNTSTRNIKEQTPKMNLTEAKRYIKRYYIRPQNVFASNKAEILQRLAEVEADGANCSVYSLKALEDHDDVHLLQPKDIIYYYDEGVLYDKNHVPVLDYDLNVKNEEERPKISADATSDERFKDVYQDRMTDRTFAEALKEDFYVDFDDVNAYGIKLKEGKEAEYTCCICGEDFEGYGNNPEPYMSADKGKCCDSCNLHFVVPMRLEQSKED
jgi:hypothetical protein